MDINKAKQAFLQYVSKYDQEDEQIQLKIVHTLHVCENSLHIAKALQLSQEQQELAYIIGLLHDIGRFEQVRIYHTFVDANSENHALLGVRILKENNFIRNFLDEERYDQIIVSAIENHNRFKIDEDLDFMTLQQTNILRDSDKADIFRVNCMEQCTILFHCTKEEIQNDRITNEVYEDVINGINVFAEKRKTKLDVLIAHIALIYDINYQESLQLIKEQGYYKTILQRYTFEHEQTMRQYIKIKEKAMSYIAYVK